MPRFELAWLLGALLALLLVIDSPEARACSVCLAGDSIYTANGASAGQAGQASIYVELLGYKKKSGELPEPESSAPEGEGGGGEEEGGAPPSFEKAPPQPTERALNRRLNVFGSWTPIDRLTLSVNVPIAFNDIVSDDGDTSTHTQLTGLGDVSITASGVLWRNRDVLPSTWLEGRLFLKAPTGPSKQRVDGDVDPHLQTGTGSWDTGFGFAVGHRLEWGSLYGSVFGRINTEGSLQYQYGNSFLANAALEVPLGHALGVESLQRFSLGGELNFRYSTHDEFHGESYSDSGGSVLYVTPSLRIRLPWFGERAPMLRAAVQVPVTSHWLYGKQTEYPVWSVGIGYSFR